MEIIQNGEILGPSLQQTHAGNHFESNEMETARQIQQSLLPKSFPVLPGFDLAGICRSAGRFSGDFYDVLQLDQDSTLLAVADVMGKGVPAALFAATLRALLRTMTGWTRRPCDLLTRINRLMFEELSAVDMFITVQLAVADVRRRRLTVASAGHCPLLLAGPHGQTDALAPEGMPLGIVLNPRFAEERAPLSSSGCALLYTDGLTEARNPHGDVFGQVRLETWLPHALQEKRTAAQLKELLLEELHHFQGGAPSRDDQTFLILSGRG
jgi:sigma-B regulation protein RsbU (phosphoserine phosphatase)